MLIGVDPGLTGAIAFLYDDGRLYEVLDMPLADKQVSAALVADVIFKTTARMAITLAVVEQVHSMPKQGVASSFKFGMGYGVVLGVLAALQIPVRHVTPTQWKKAMRVTSNKETSRRRAIETWPYFASGFALKKHADRAEAALIARWAWEQEHRS